MNILYVSHVAILGGAERSLLDLIAALDRQHYSARVVLPAVGEFSERLTHLQVPVDVCPLLGRLRRRPSLLRQGMQALRVAASGLALQALRWRYTPTLIHANSTTA